MKIIKNWLKGNVVILHVELKELSSRTHGCFQTVDQYHREYALLETFCRSGTYLKGMVAFTLARQLVDQMETRLLGRLLMLQSNVSAVKRSFSSYLFLGCLFLCLFNWSFPVSPLPCRRHLPPLINRTYLHIFPKVPQSVLPIYTWQEVCHPPSMSVNILWLFSFDL